MILWACDRWEAYKGPIKTLFECEDTREVNGENALSITTLARLDKGDRLVWRDLKGRWHENIVDGVEASSTRTTARPRRKSSSWATTWRTSAPTT